MATMEEGAVIEGNIAERLIPDGGMLQRIKTAEISLRQHIVETAPDVIITSGRSAVVTRIALHKINRDLGERIPVLRLSTGGNAMIYKYFFPEISEAERLRKLSLEIDELKATHPILKPDATVLFVDEYADTGTKSIVTIARMFQLGYEKARLAVLASSGKADFEDRISILQKAKELAERRGSVFDGAFELIKSGKLDFSGRMFIASSDAELFLYLQELSQQVTHTKVMIWETGSTDLIDELFRKAAPRMKQALVETFQRIRRIDLSTGNNKQKIKPLTNEVRSMPPSGVRPSIGGQV